MSTARLSTAELVNELRSALTAGRWLQVAAGTAPLSTDAELADIAKALNACSSAASLPAAAKQLLDRAFQAVTRVLEPTADAADKLYGELGAAYAYLVQTRRLLEEDGAR